jgi:hypothetical protein
MKRDYICKSCNKPFSRDDCGKNPTYCSFGCLSKYREKRRKHYICEHCGKEFIREPKDKNKTFCCLVCYKTHRSENKIQTKEYLKEWNKKYQIDNKEEIIKKRKEYREKNINIIRKKSIIKGKTPNGKYSYYKATAKRRDIEFNLTLEQFTELWNKPCYYCGDEIKTIGVDRVDNTKGYQVDNIVPCCAWCNKMKLNYTKEEFINHCEKIVNFNK